jgi:stage III sporulation protein AH
VVYMKILKRNQIIVTVIALMLVAAGYLNFANQNRENNLIPTSSVADSEMMAGIGDAQLVNANEVSQNNVESDTNQENIVNEVKNTNISEQTQEDSYFDETRLEREKMYSQMLENYQKILETNNLSSDEKKNAQEEIKEINNEKNAIMIAENLVKTKGFKDIIIFKNNGNVTAIIKADKLEEKEISQLQNIITRELNVSINKINISKK